jgi:hypothetical protein
VPIALQLRDPDGTIVCPMFPTGVATLSASMGAEGGDA